MKNLILFVLLCFSVSLSAQHKVGVRAGTNYSKFSGPLEEAESYSFSSGIHFGINYTYIFNDDFSVRAEILYQQKGTEQFLKDDDIYNFIIPITAGFNRFVDYGTVDYSLKNSLSYFSIPITAQVQVSKKFEVFGGFSLDFMLGANGKGKQEYLSRDKPNELFYTQLSLDYKYGNDVAGQYNTRSNTISLIIDETSVDIPGVVGAYYDYRVGTELENRFKGFDTSLIGGVNYFINPGFYIGARLEYGLLDLTNDNMDISLRELDSEENFILRNDKDTNINLAFSFGFRF